MIEPDFMEKFPPAVSSFGKACAIEKLSCGDKLFSLIPAEATDILRCGPDPDNASADCHD
jgi:hypothetical protein